MHKILSYSEFMNRYNDPNVIISIKTRLDELYGRCFLQEFSIRETSETYVVLGTTTDKDVLESPEYIDFIVTVYVFPDRVEWWGVCGSVEASVSGLNRKILQQIVQENTILYVDYENPYWNRAVGLYTSIGFEEPVHVILDEKPLLRLKYTDGINDKHQIRNECNRMRGEFYNSIGCHTQRTVFSSSDMAIFSEMASRFSREYGGSFGIREDNIYNLKHLYVGNYIHYGKATVNPKESNYLVFHTHPDSTRIHMLTSPPSSSDLIYTLHNYRKIAKHYIFESTKLGGFYTVQLNPRIKNLLNFAYMEMLVEKIRDAINITLNGYFDYICQLKDILDSIDDIEYHRNELVTQILSKYNQITLKNINMIQAAFDPEIENVPIFWVEYNKYSNSDFIDYVISDLKPSKVDGLLLGPNIFPIFDVLEVLDQSGTIHGCHLDNEYGLQTECTRSTKPEFKCTDKWEGVDLLEIIRDTPDLEQLKTRINSDL